MTIDSRDQEALEALEYRLRAILPEQYQDCYEDVQPVSMSSTPLKYGSDGKVAWDDIWDSFCDLAMAGGPPHKGKLLEPGAVAEIEAHPDRYKEVLEEICRGVGMVTRLAAMPSPIAGWVRVECESSGMAQWLVRAIVMENIAAHWESDVIDLPAGPGYRVEKEIKNVITATAKTCHYWLEHMWSIQRREISGLFEEMADESPLIQPALPGPDFRDDLDQLLKGKMAETIERSTGLRSSSYQYAGWLGVDCPDVHAAIWMMRALVVSNVLSRREGTALFVPVNPESDPKGEVVTQSVARIHGFAIVRNVL